jgi:hypothetical protein
MARPFFAFAMLFSIGGIFAQQATKNVVPKEIFGVSVYRAFYSPQLPPVGSKKTTFVVQEPVTARSPVNVLPAPSVQAVPGRADTPAKTTTNKSDEQPTRR